MKQLSLFLISAALLSACGNTVKTMPEMQQNKKLPKTAKLVQEDSSANAPSSAMESALNRAYVANLNQTITWENGNETGGITPRREGYNDKGEYCRELESETIKNNRKKSLWITACQNINGVWNMVR